MTFEEFSLANRKRARELEAKSRMHDWSIAEWTNALCGEAGEAANIAKKMVRGDALPEGAYDALADEMADVIIYADLVLAKFGRSLTDTLRAKFNVVSDRWDSKVRL